jgi:lipopolysaccharide transport system permease protein
MEHESAEQVIEIVPRRGFLFVDFGELWAYRELLFLFAWRDATVRYKQSVVGVAWAVLQPLLMVLIFTVVFGRFAGLPSEGVPYSVFALCGLLPWNYFARALSDSSNSLVGSAHLVTKVYFPRLILPLSRVFSGLIDFAITFLLLLGFLAWYRIVPARAIVFLPVFIVFAILTSLAVGLWLTALNVRYRDVSFVVPFLVQFWMYATPIAYSSELVPERWRTLYALNPMASVVEGFRWALLGRRAPDPAAMAVSLAIVLLLLVTGLYYFRRTEHTLVDVI